MAELKTLLGSRQDRFKGGFSGGLYNYFWSQGCFPDRELDATLRGKSEELGKDGDATLSDRDKNTP